MTRTYSVSKSKNAPLLALVLLILQACASVPVASPTPAPTVPLTPTHPPLTAGPLPCTKIGQVRISQNDGVTLVCIPAGEFLMGAAESDPDAKPYEKPQHTVYLDAYWVDRTEVTNARFQECVTAGACSPRPARRGTTGVASLKHLNYYYDAEFANFPVLIYEAEDAITYCKWAGRRLPTEAEWEKAARGTDGRSFPWGTDKDCSHATFFGCTEDTTNVESNAPGASPYGALNMAGNVWEWVSDQYSADYYAHSPSRNPTGPESGEGNVRRGGGWRSLSRDLRVTARASGTGQHYFDGQMGFRCAMSDVP